MNYPLFHGSLARQVRRTLLDSRFMQSLAYPHGVDRYLELLNPLWAISQVRARITAVVHGTSDSVTLTLQPNSNWLGFEAGQYIGLTAEIEGVRRTRYYSLANSSYDTNGQIEVTVKAHSWGLVSQYLKQHAEVGQVLDLTQAQGDFILPVSRPDHFLLISGGSGITPIIAMLRTLCDEHYSGKITVLHYCRNPQELIYGDVLRGIAKDFANVELQCIFTRDPDLHEGNEFNSPERLSLEQLQCRVPGFAQALTYVCGPPGLLEQAELIWCQQGISQRLNIEHFTASVLAFDHREDPLGTVSFLNSARDTRADGRSLLLLAEAAGIRPASGCRMGICATCTCKKSTGIVRNLITGELSGEPNEDIRLCISVPLGNVSLNL